MRRHPNQRIARRLAFCFLSLILVVFTLLDLLWARLAARKGVTAPFDQLVHSCWKLSRLSASPLFWVASAGLALTIVAYWVF